ncbi:hypothetical protein O6H91_04G069300 [Diphasiastrum complanatum]|uniref:Uncharacterized protein n=1 Tax=Diphasiastrum complanatum TaxID=34168 RepID=A0ACC2DYJ2_DIPCM|nr:hypothetical protein O6H91_04G069300 [Diphasiastrum complanatum]
MDLAALGRDPLLSSVHQLLYKPDEHDKSVKITTPAGSYARDKIAVSRTAVDVKDLPKAYIFLADMPGVKASDTKVQIENDNVLCISGERKQQDHENDTDHAKYLRLERGAGKFLRKFTLPANAKLEGISATFTDGVLTVVIPKIPPPEPKTINVVNIAA